MAVIRVEKLSKQYQIGAREKADKTFREMLMGAVAAPFRRFGRLAGRAGEDEHFWALKDVSFDVQPGEVIGIIGRNGAGKSTLLKILSKITEPTSGRAEIIGRVASLLEVGTGFHPELTGRENIYLNGAILGMSRAEIRRKFDEIVEFSEIGRYLDTPVKRYSSGMYVRLAFAVAAHLEPEILIVDEVLAVGDARFQRKCIGKMGEVSESGRTVLFVSHNMSMIQRLCERVVLLERGEVAGNGDAAGVVRRYLDSGYGTIAERAWTSPSAAPGDAVARLRAVRVMDHNGQIAEVMDIRKPIFVEVEYWSLQSAVRPAVSIHLMNQEGVLLFVSNDFTDTTWWNASRIPGIVRSRCEIPGNFLAEGTHVVLAAVCTYNPTIVHAIEKDAVAFQVVDRSDGDAVRGEFVGSWPGLIRPMLEWTVSYVDGKAASL
jgi:lipopolysaccharide transport system ATP-binding protein